MRTSILGLVLAAFAAAPSVLAATYTVVDIGVPDDSADPSSVQAYGLNNLGEVTGSFTLANGEAHAFLYTLGIMKDLGTLGGKTSVGLAVNDSSEVTGSSTLSDSSSVEHAFLHNGVFMDDLGTLGGPSSQGRGINSSGEVTGDASLDAVIRHAFFFNGTSMDDLGVLAGSSSHGNAINDVGMITGGSTSLSGVQHGFFYDGLEMHDIGTLGISISEGRAINATGQITGFSFALGGSQHAFFYDGVNMNDLSTLGGAKSFGNGINDDGVITGLSEVDQTALTHAFVWDGSMHDLNDLIVDLPPGVTIELHGPTQYGVVINRSGQIAVSGRYLTGGPGPSATRAFLLTPVPEPLTATSALMASATLVGIRVARRTRRRGRASKRPTAHRSSDPG